MSERVPAACGPSSDRSRAAAPRPAPAGDGGPAEAGPPPSGRRRAGEGRPAGDRPGPGRVRVAVLTGPTAVGKTQLALALAEAVGAEIVNADATAVYRGMDIGTDKPAPAARARVPHHLLDVCDPREAFSAARYQPLARAAIGGIAARGRLPLLVGGSGLYIRAAVRSLDLPPAPPDPELRARLAARPPAELHAALAAIDPEAARRIPPGNARRVVRALEVARATGRPPSSFWAADRAASPYDLCYLVLDRPREELYRRIAARVRREFDDGLADEVARLLAAGVPPEAPSMQGLGYKEVVPYVRGAAGLAETTALLVRHTRRFAKRQLTWFRGEPNARWHDVTALGEAATLDVLVHTLRQGGSR